LGVQPLTQLTACRLHFLLNQTLAIAPICEVKSNRHHPLARAPQDVSLSVSAAMIAGALHIPNVRYPRLCPKSIRKTDILSLNMVKPSNRHQAGNFVATMGMQPG
jgi:hypothetical protein